MTATAESPVASPVKGLDMLELEITGKCQLSCTHCLTESSPRADHGTMTTADWRAVIADAATLGIPKVQLIGGEPTVHPNWREFTELALSLGMRVEVYSNLFHVRPAWWDTFSREGVTLGTSYYSDRADEHDRITGRPGSYQRTRAHILEALKRGIGLRVGMVDVLPGQRVAEGRTELEAMGVRRIQVDRARAVGRAALPGQAPSLGELCGHCAHGRAAILPNGNLAGCVLSRGFPVGNVRERPLAELLWSRQWGRLVERIPRPRRKTAVCGVCGVCTPHDSEGCDPSNEACDPTD
ncbi:radical SAM/SPASM domain-containing protein [Streptomyces daliensis]|uniref:Radical SAM protein n=1 Tax=Streptomyces daliensis TaxID=299421 RepID=A0A8T4IKA7_9ACTN|nr:radical SAM protein [Streptomyces daliensis]